MRELPVHEDRLLYVLGQRKQMRSNSLPSGTTTRPHKKLPILLVLSDDNSRRAGSGQHEEDSRSRLTRKDAGPVLTQPLGQPRMLCRVKICLMAEQILLCCDSNLLLP
jgi:hypothetical protein